MPSQKTTIDISFSTIIKLILVILAVWFLFFIRDIAVLFFLVLIIVAALTPLVDKLSQRAPRALVVTFLGLILIGVLVGIGFSIIPPLVTEVKELAINLPIITAKLGPINRSIQAYTGNYQENLFNLSSQIGNLTTGIFSTTIGFVSGVFAFVLVIVLSFYMLVDQESASAYFYKLLSPDKREQVSLIIKKISVKMGHWLGGNLVLMLFIGILDLIALSVLGVPYALILAIWGGLVEVIPYLGPWLGLVPAVIIALTVSPLTALFVAIAFIIIQQLESNFIAPKIIGRAIGLSPVIIILSLLIGAKLLGLLGIIIAVPTAAIISVFVTEWAEIKQLNK